MTDDSLKYRAFISYSRADRKLVERLHRRLEAYVLPSSVRRIKPGVRLDARPLRPIFLDDHELVPGPDLPKAISEKLNASEFLIVACSSNSHRSRWVDLEVREFIRLERRDRIITLVLSGEPNATARGLSSELECLPQTLLSESYERQIGDGTEPLWVDWRPAAREQRKMFLRIVAALVRFDSLDQLIRRDAIARRRRLIFSATAVALAAVLTFVAVNALIAKERNRSQIFSEASQRAYQAGSYDKALLYSLLALPPPHGASLDFSSRETQIAAYRAAHKNRRVFRLPMPTDYDNYIDNPVVSPDLKRAWTWIGQKRAQLIDLENSRILADFDWSYVVDRPPAVFDSSSGRLAVSDGKRLLVLDASTGRQLLTLLTDRVSSLAAFPARGRIAGIVNSSIIVWDLFSGQRVSQFYASPNANNIGLSGDGLYCIAAIRHGAFAVWRILTGKQIALIEVFGQKAGLAPRAALSRDGRKVLISLGDLMNAGGMSWLYELKSRTILAQVPFTGQNRPFRPSNAAFSPDGKLVIVPLDENHAIALDAHSGATVFKLEGTGGWPEQCLFLPNRQRIVTVANNSVNIWDSSTGRKLDQLPIDEEVNLVAISVDGSRITLAGMDEISIWDATAKTSSKLIGSDLRDVTALTMSSDGSMVAVLSDQSLRVFNSASSGKIFDVRVPSNDGGAIDFSNDGSQLAITLPNHVVQAWQLPSGRQNPLLADGVYRGIGISSVAFSPFGKTAALGLGDSTARLIDLSTHRELAVLRGHRNEVTSVSFSHDGKLLLTASSDSTARVWDIPTARLLSVLQANTIGELLSAHFSQDASQIVTVSANGSVEIWASSGKLLRNLKSESKVEGAFFSSDDKRIYNQFGQVWDSRSLQPLQVPSDVIAVSPNASMIVTNKLEIYDAEGAGLIAPLSSSPQDADRAAFSPNGALIIAALKDGTVQMWPTPELAGGRALAIRFCQPEIAGSLQLMKSDLSEYIVVTRPGDEKPCTRAGMLPWKYSLSK